MNAKSLVGGHHINDLESLKPKFVVIPRFFIYAIGGNKGDLAMLQWLWDRCDQSVIKTAIHGWQNLGRVVFQKALNDRSSIKVLDWLWNHDLGWKCYCNGSCYCKKISWSILQKIAFSQSNDTLNFSRDVLIWLHQHGAAVLSNARVLQNGKIWLHEKCIGRDSEYLCSQYRYGDTTNLIWDKDKIVGEYLISRE